MTVHRNTSRAFAFWRLKDPARSLTICSTNLHVRHRVAAAVVPLGVTEMRSTAKRQLLKRFKDVEKSE